MPVPIFQVDSFTARPFAGNPAGVCLPGGPREAAWMQAVAAEMNLSETAFLWPEGEGFRLRWFTPAAEVALCGHATLASAHVLWGEGLLPASAPVRFATASGLLAATRRPPLIELDFPATPPQEAEEPEGLAAALGAEPRWVGRSRFDLLVLLDDEAEVRGLAPDIARLRRLEARGFIVTAPSASPDHDFVSRFFAPAVGVAEDPVTGSAHCCLAPFWAERLDRPELVGHQVSARGGFVRVRLEGGRVLLAGEAVTVLRGELLA
jgi:PhzF family phenazine biosynthesis protein